MLMVLLCELGLNWITVYRLPVCMLVGCLPPVSGVLLLFVLRLNHVVVHIILYTLTPVICHFWGVGNLESIFLVLRYLPNYDFSIFLTVVEVSPQAQNIFSNVSFCP